MANEEQESATTAKPSIARGLLKGLMYGLLAGALIGAVAGVGYAAFTLYLVGESLNIGILGLVGHELIGMEAFGMASIAGGVIGSAIAPPICALLGGAGEAAKKRAWRQRNEKTDQKTLPDQPPSTSSLRSGHGLHANRDVRKSL